MRAWVWRGGLATTALAMVLATFVGVKTFNRACDGSLEGLRYLSNVRTQIAEVTALPPTPRPATPTPTPPPAATPTAVPTVQPTPVPPTPTPAPPTVAQQALAAAGQAGDTAIAWVLVVKQHDAVAYPAHIVAAHLLETAGCSKDAVRIQWLKAGLHATGEGQPATIAAALAERTAGPDDLAELRRIVRTWTERAPRSISLRQVLEALDARG